MNTIDFNVEDILLIRIWTSMKIPIPIGHQ